MTDPLSESLRWAIEIGVDPTRTSIDWLAGELVPGVGSGVDAILDASGRPAEQLERLRLLKNGFKTLRISAEEASVRRLAARYYAATIAAALVRLDEWITTQRPVRVRAASQAMIEDEGIDDELRRIGREAIERLDRREATTTTGDA